MPDLTDTTPRTDADEATRMLASELRAEADVLSGKDQSVRRVYGCEDIADRIRRIADKLVAPEPASADLLAARRLASNSVLRLGRRLPDHFSFQVMDRNDRIIFTDDTGGVVARINAGQADASVFVQEALDAITEGRTLERADVEAQKMRDMAAAPVPGGGPYLVDPSWSSDRLTITITGPQGSGKTLLGEALVREFPIQYRPLFKANTINLDPHIIEIRDGRRFDVRADVFID